MEKFKEFAARPYKLEFKNGYLGLLNHVITKLILEGK